jgi:phospholipase A1/A2
MARLRRRYRNGAAACVAWMVVAVLSYSAQAALAQDDPATEPADEPAREAGLVEYLADRFSPHEPMYFLWGDERPNVKFQISLKYQLFNPEGSLSRDVPAARGVYVAYTQLSFLDSQGTTSVDSSYMPALLFQYEDLFRDRLPSWLAELDVQVGLQHESNGQTGVESRSLNIAYVRPVFSFGDPHGRDHGWFASAAPRVFGYVSSLDENPDINDFRGHADLRLIVGRFEGLQLASIVRIPDDFDFGNAGSLQLDLSYPLRKLSGNNLDLYLHAQYFTGYGETLVGYDQKDDTFRVGLSIVR